MQNGNGEFLNPNYLPELATRMNELARARQDTPASMNFLPATGVGSAPNGVADLGLFGGFQLNSNSQANHQTGSAILIRFLEKLLHNTEKGKDPSENELHELNRLVVQRIVDCPNKVKSPASIENQRQYSLAIDKLVKCREQGECPDRSSFSDGTPLMNLIVNVLLTTVPGSDPSYGKLWELFAALWESMIRLWATENYFRKMMEKAPTEIETRQPSSPSLSRPPSPQPSAAIVPNDTPILSINPLLLLNLQAQAGIHGLNAIQGTDPLSVQPLLQALFAEIFLAYGAINPLGLQLFLTMHPQVAPALIAHQKRKAEEQEGPASKRKK